MAEVYTISGAAFDEKVEALKRATAAAKASLIPRKVSTAAVPPVARLQNALKALGVTKGDPTLSKLKVDGVVGPGTTKAVNYAIAQRYVVMPSFPNPNLTVQHVRQFAVGIAAAIEGAVTAGGGSLTPVRVARTPASRAAPPIDVTQPEATSDLSLWWGNYKWWVIGGAAALVGLTVVAKLVRVNVKPRYRVQETEA